jgi:O-antigen/teichoic acid export membrane protein
MLFNVITLILSLLLSFIFGMYGYVIALSVSFVVFSVLLKRYFKQVQISRLMIPKREFWKYSVGSATANFLHSSISSLDTFMVGFFLTAVNIAEYRIASIIPFNLFFIAQMFIITDYPKFIKNYQNKGYFKSYMKNYFVIFFIIGLILISLFFLFGNFIIQLLFGSDYQANGTFYLLIVTSVFCLLVLIPFGNITAALGLIRKNAFASIGALCIQIIFGLFLIPEYGILGAATATSLGYLFSGFFNMISIYSYFKKI